LHEGLMGKLLRIFEFELALHDFEVTGSKSRDSLDRLFEGLVQPSRDKRSKKTLVEDDLAFGLQIPEFQFVVETAKTGAIQVGETVCCKDLNSPEIFDAVEELVRKAQFPRVLGLIAIEDQGIGFVNHQDSLRLRLLISRADVCLCFPHVRAKEITSSFDDKFFP